MTTYRIVNWDRTLDSGFVLDLMGSRPLEVVRRGLAAGAYMTRDLEVESLENTRDGVVRGDVVANVSIGRAWLYVGYGFEPLGPIEVRPRSIPTGKRP